jgi:hypothetical protein
MFDRFERFRRFKRFREFNGLRAVKSFQDLRAAPWCVRHTATQDSANSWFSVRWHENDGPR